MEWWTTFLDAKRERPLRARRVLARAPTRRRALGSHHGPDRGRGRHRRLGRGRPSPISTLAWPTPGHSCCRAITSRRRPRPPSRTRSSRSRRQPRDAEAAAPPRSPRRGADRARRHDRHGCLRRLRARGRSCWFGPAVRAGCRCGRRIRECHQLGAARGPVPRFRRHISLRARAARRSVGVPRRRRVHRRQDRELRSRRPCRRRVRRTNASPHRGGGRRHLHHGRQLPGDRRRPRR